MGLIFGCNTRVEKKPGIFDNLFIISIITFYADIISIVFFGAYFLAIASMMPTLSFL
jgi:hypothetical protein